MLSTRRQRTRIPIDSRHTLQCTNATDELGSLLRRRAGNRHYLSHIIKRI